MVRIRASQPARNQHQRHSRIGGRKKTTLYTAVPGNSGHLRRKCDRGRYQRDPTKSRADLGRVAAFLTLIAKTVVNKGKGSASEVSTVYEFIPEIRTDAQSSP
ncbi:hypothetical protein NDU88_004063 [Pleurodeles waltl]|uniref:Uncharacterized protein n=1 Tax=Pleurodeles waltl TaxID=8319 RepID=A0AAV7TRD5_PLEWA|nr:hypothetical protein NDU88_004063 [Pleurodeles waltl]